MDYTKLTIAEIANGISKTEAAIRRCREILDDLQEPKTVGMQAVVKAIRDLLPKLEEDLKSLERAYAKATRRKPLGR
jgi:DNA-directed RNA polymerase subunit F